MLTSTQDHSILDMSAVFTGQLAKVVRGVELLADRTVLVQDEIQATAAPAKVRWAMVTRAAVKLAGDHALLQSEGKQLALRVLSPGGVTVKTYPTDPPPHDYDARNKGTRLVGFEVMVPASGKQTLVVALVPGGATASPIKVRPLASW